MIPIEVPEAEIEVDLGAVAANWRDLCARHGATVAGVVKADGYGLGAAPVAKALAAAGCQHFFVAQFAEGIALRQALGHGPMIAILGGFPPGADAGAQLTAVLNTPQDTAAHAAAAPAPAGLILHLDTGMERLGLNADECAALPSGALNLRYVMTHLACADEPAHPLNTIQAARFASAANAFPNIPRSFANSAGLFLGADYASDLARPGCALYGINPTPGHPNPMRQVMRLTVPVLQIRQIAAGTPVGYGATWVAKRDSRVATIAAGYADGYLRSLSSRGIGIVAGCPVPLVGRVSMDLITLDVTDAPDLRPGDRVEMIGPNQTPDDVAALAGTIGYEVLTSLGARYRRRYLPA
jgi:alanine racemase